MTATASPSLIIVVVVVVVVRGRAGVGAAMGGGRRLGRVAARATPASAPRRLCSPAPSPFSPTASTCTRAGAGLRRPSSSSAPKARAGKRVWLSVAATLAGAEQPRLALASSPAPHGVRGEPPWCPGQLGQGHDDRRLVVERAAHPRPPPGSLTQRCNTLRFIVALIFLIAGKHQAKSFHELAGGMSKGKGLSLADHR